MALPYTDREVLEWLVEGKHLLYHGPDGWRLERNEIYAHCGKRLLDRGLIELAHSRRVQGILRYEYEVGLYRISRLGRLALEQDAASTLGGIFAGATRNAFDGQGRPIPRPHGPRPVRAASPVPVEVTLDGSVYTYRNGKWVNAATNLVAPKGVAQRLSERLRRQQ
jgi:hypothetical protein